MITAEKLTRKYGTGELATTALKPLDVEIRQGEFVAIVGPSGAGKSTLLYQLSLLDTPSSGEVFFDGVKTAKLTEAGKTAIRLHKMGFVFQDYALLPELTALENVALPMLMQNRTHAEAYAKAEIALRKIGLENKKQNLPSQLSGGQQQRVSIARAIAHEPHVLFADEPTANLDSANSAHVLEAFLELNKDGQTIIMVTHELEYARKAQRVITLVDGTLTKDERR